MEHIKPILVRKLEKLAEKVKNNSGDATLLEERAKNMKAEINVSVQSKLPVEVKDFLKTLYKKAEAGGEK